MKINGQDYRFMLIFNYDKHDLKSQYQNHYWPMRFSININNIGLQYRQYHPYQPILYIGLILYWAPQNDIAGIWWNQRVFETMMPNI